MVKFLVVAAIALSAIYGFAAKAKEPMENDPKDPRAVANYVGAVHLGQISSPSFVKYTDTDTGYVCYVATLTGSVDVQCLPLKNK